MRFLLSIDFQRLEIRSREKSEQKREREREKRRGREEETNEGRENHKNPVSLGWSLRVPRSVKKTGRSKSSSHFFGFFLFCVCFSLVLPLREVAQIFSAIFFPSFSATSPFLVAVTFLSKEEVKGFSLRGEILRTGGKTQETS